MSEAAYVCTLDEASLKVAKEELGEDPSNRQGAIETLREWVKQQKHLTFTTDTNVLLAYLRYSKFSQLRARKTIENYCKYKTETPGWFNNFNPNDDAVEKLVKCGYILPLPGHDEKGRIRVLHREAAYNPSEWKNKKDEMVRAMFAVFFSILRDEKCQVNGLVMLSDFTGLTLAHQTFFSLDEMKKQIKYWQSTMPGRYKGLYNYNCGSIFEALFNLCKPFLSSKMRERMVMAGSNMEDLYHVFPKEVLPLEYLPDDYKGPSAGTMAQMADKFLREVRKPDMADFLALVSNPEWRMEQDVQKDDVPAASFRKLNVD